MTTTYDTIREAIIDKKRVFARYKGRDRELCPHCIGWKNDKAHGLFFQCGGESSSGLSKNPADNWRCMVIDDLENVRVVEGAWVTAENHSRPASCIDIIDVEVDY